MLLPGALLFVANYSTCARRQPSADSCFSGGHATTLCRAFADSCSVGQRIAADLSVDRAPDPKCTRYRWRWECAAERQELCGPHSCDPAGECVDDVCVCPEPLSGDPTLGCACEVGQFNGTHCLPDPPGRPGCSSDSFAWILASYLFAGATAVGCAVYLLSMRAPARPRAHLNPAFEEASGDNVDLELGMPARSVTHI